VSCCHLDKKTNKQKNEFKYQSQEKLFSPPPSLEFTVQRKFPIACEGGVISEFPSKYDLRGYIHVQFHRKLVFMIIPIPQVKAA